MADEMTSATQGAPEGEAAVTPAETTAPDTGTEQPAAQPETTAETPPPEKPKAAVPKWAEKRFAELTRQVNEERRLREAAEAAARGAQQPADPSQTRSTPETDVEKRAAQIVAQREFDKACNTAWEAGTTKYGENFDAALGTLRTMGVLRPEVVEAALATEAAPDVLHYLGSNPDEADRILSLPPTRMAVELVKVAQTAAKPTPKPASSAPAPIKPVGGTRQVSEEPADGDDMATWMRKREAQIAKRRGA